MKNRIFNNCMALLGMQYLLLIGCNNKPKEIPVSKGKKQEGKTIVNGKWEAFPIGDINNDTIPDTAFVFTPAYYGTINLELPTNDNVEFEGCIDSKCYNKIKFSNDFPSIQVEKSLWGKIESIEDLDDDGIKELIFQTNWYIGTHVEIIIYSFDKRKRKWMVLAENNLYGEDRYKDRVTKINKEKFRFKIEYMDTIAHDLMNKEIVVKIRK